jgi:hypothetical protein
MIVPGRSRARARLLTRLAYGALYIVQVNPTAASTTNITGTAALTGMVGANFAPGSYTRRSYTILSAAEGRTGTFDLLLPSGLPVGFQPSLRMQPLR